ncbi:MAG: cobalamin B12-binding domain-containing protein, partial [Chloroflexi bacterium]|nr:cobalamin B12-binding domain-containing protein [Chloroflexota bacterium]
MNILFVYPTKLNASEKPIKYRKAFIPPLALAILNGLTPDHHNVHLVDDIVEDIDFAGSYDLVAITAMTMQVERAYQIADAFRDRGVKVIMGGMHPTVLPQEAKQHADSVVIGEADNIWEQILDDCENNTLKDFYQDESFPDLQRLVIPKWDNLNLGIYAKRIGSKMPTMPIFTSRGCPLGCKFCSVTKFFGKSIRVKPISHVMKEIESTGAT